MTTSLLIRFYMCYQHYSSAFGLISFHSAYQDFVVGKTYKKRVTSQNVTRYVGRVRADAALGPTMYAYMRKKTINIIY